MKALKCIFPDTGKIVNFRQFTTTSKLYPLTEGGTLMRMMRLAPNFRAGCARKGRIGLIQRFLDPPRAFSLFSSPSQCPNLAASESKTKISQTHTLQNKGHLGGFVWEVFLFGRFKYRQHPHPVLYLSVLFGFYKSNRELGETKISPYKTPIQGFNVYLWAYLPY